MQKRLLALSMTLCLTGCARIVVETNTYLGDLTFPESTSATSIYVEAQAAKQPVLLVREVARAVVAELERQGFTCVAKAEDANFVLSVLFGMDQGRLVTETTPQTSNYYAMTHYHAGGGYVGTVYTSGSDTAYAERTYREFDRQLFMTLVDRQTYDRVSEDARDQAIVWEASSLSTGENRDLRLVVRCMLAAAFEHFGEDTGRAQRDSFRADSREVQRFNLRASRRGE